MPQPPCPTSDMLALLRGVSRSFYLSIRLLPAALRLPVAVAYLLARAADTVADTTRLPAGERRAHLETLAQSIEDPTPRLAAETLSQSLGGLQDDGRERQLIFRVPQCLGWLEALDRDDRDDVRAVLRHIVGGQALDLDRFDLDQPPRALETAAQLDEYTYLVAGCVGEFWTDLGFRHLPSFARLPRQEMRELGRGYGMGLQLVNILRDAGADLAAGRCYFPADELAAAGLEARDIAHEPERFEPVWQRWQAQAQRGLDLGIRYAEAVHSRRVRAASALPALLGNRTLALLRAAGPRRLEHRVKMPRREVRRVMGRLALTFAARAPLLESYHRLGWDNRGP